jgi:hypothetical protein
MGKALVVNCSPGYNLGANKIANWLRSQGDDVSFWTGDPGMFSYGYDRVYLSVIFSWHALTARDIALRVKGISDVECGGPGMFALRNWWKRETGLDCHSGLDDRFEHQRGDYKMTFASRGCPVGCWFCIVPKLEGKEFTLYYDFQPAPFLCDNNLSALPVEFQEHIIKRYQETGTILKDANSGFEPQTFDEGTYRRWKPVISRWWRFAFDTTSEAADVERMMNILKDEPASNKRVYVLIGNEPFEACHERIAKVREWGGEPYCQPVIALNALDKKPMVKHDWTEQKLIDTARWANRFLWRYIEFSEYRAGVKTSSQPEAENTMSLFGSQ